MSTPSLEDLALSASETPSVEALAALSNILNPGVELTSTQQDSIDLLFESCAAIVDHDPGIARALISLCEKLNSASNTVRNTLSIAIKFQLPPYLTRQGYQRSLGLRERAVLPPEIVRRFYAMLELTTGLYCYMPEAKAFGKIDFIDDLAGSIGVTSLKEAVTYRVANENALPSFLLFKGTMATLKLITVQPKRDVLSSEEWRHGMQAAALLSVSPARYKEMARTIFVPTVYTAEEFEAWWVAEAAPKTQVKSERQVGQARSLLELQQLIERSREKDPDYRLSDEDVEPLKSLWTRQRPPQGIKDIKATTDVLNALTEVSSPEQLRAVLEHYVSKLIFCPRELSADMALEPLEIWGALSAKELPPLLRMTQAIFGNDYLCAVSNVLPLKALNALFTLFDAELIRKSIFATGYLSSDMLVWIWKNRKAASSDYLNLLTMDSVINAMSQPNMPKYWTAAQRELKRYLIEDANFLKTVVNNHDDKRTIIYAVQRAKGISAPEQQSLLVKLAGHNDDLRVFIESGEGQRMMNAANAALRKNEPEPQKIEPYISSIKSVKKRQEDLNHLINVLIPQNRVAIEEARAHGDFRENSEFDAAKERRRQLNGMRATYERELENAAAIDFRSVDPHGVVVPGCMVKYKTASGTEMTCYVVGAWDGDAERDFIAYRAPLGAALMNLSAGSKTTLPNGAGIVLTAVEKLPEEILKLLD